MNAEIITTNAMDKNETISISRWKKFSECFGIGSIPKNPKKDHSIVGP